MQITFTDALVINHGPPRGGQGIAVEMSGALTKVLPRQCGGKYPGFALYKQKGQ